MFGGIIGVYTGVKKGAFSISVNQREYNDHEVGLVENLSMILAGYDQVSWLVRETLEKCNDFACAHKKLSKTKINSIAYIIVAGVKENEGVVVTRHRTGTTHEEAVSTEGNWFVVQTNSDHWREGCRDRCQAATENLIRVSQFNISHDTLRHEVLLQQPNLNGDTIYNTAFDPSTGMMDTIPTQLATGPRHPLVRETKYDFNKFHVSRDLTLTDPLFFFKNPEVAFGMFENLASVF